MGRGGTKASALIWGPSTSRRRHTTARPGDGYTLDFLRDRYGGELERYQRLEVNPVGFFPGQEEANALCRELKGRTMLLIAGTEVARWIDKERRHVPETLEKDMLITVVNAMHAHTTTAREQMPATVSWDQDGHGRRHRYRVNLADVALLFPVGAVPGLPES